MNGYPKNRNKKKDNYSDIVPSFKHNEEAEIGELFFSREDGKLAFKKDIGEFVFYDVSQTLVGPQGPIGPQGVAGPVGPAGLEWQGAWVSGTTYAIDDAVGYDGASWFCISPTSGITAPDLDITHWALLAAQGAQGPQGPQGPGLNFNAPEIIGLQIEDGTIVTGAPGALVKSASIRIPANTLGDRELLEIVWSTNRFAGTNNGVITPFLYLNTSDTLSGSPIQLATGTTLNNNSYNVKTGRDIRIMGGQGLVSVSYVNHASDYSAVNMNNTTFAFNTDVDNYFIFAVSNAHTVDKSFINRARITRYTI
jgi:hypothetical protein